MKIPPRMRAPSLFIFVALLAPLARGADELPPPELTEIWEPAPPVIAAPPHQPPSDATVLFDGSTLEAWTVQDPNLWRIEDGAMVVVRQRPAPTTNIHTRQAFGDVQLHLEWRAPAEVKGAGQGRGNSGVFFMDHYELQVLDSYQNPTYVNGQAASIYKQHAPLVNASRPPGEWQTYDVVFIAPRFNADGSVARPARMTVFHNGVLVQHDFELRGPTVYRGEPKYTPHASKLPIRLQDHGNPVAFRNIWVREITLPDAR